MRNRKMPPPPPFYCFDKGFNLLCQHWDKSRSFSLFGQEGGVWVPTRYRTRVPIDSCKDKDVSNVCFLGFRFCLDLNMYHTFYNFEVHWCWRNDASVIQWGSGTAAFEVYVLPLEDVYLSTSIDLQGALNAEGQLATVALWSKPRQFSSMYVRLI